MADATPTGAIKTVPKPRDQHLRDMADCIRFLSMDAVQQANSGHPGAPLGMADIAIVLFRDFMLFDAADPRWFDHAEGRLLGQGAGGPAATRFGLTQL
jgi:transketolase